LTNATSVTTAHRVVYSNRYATRYVDTPRAPYVKGQGNGKSITLQGRGEGVPEGWGQGEGGVARHHRKAHLLCALLQ
jgi:hypothetical protein